MILMHSFFLQYIGKISFPPLPEKLTLGVTLSTLYLPVSPSVFICPWRTLLYWFGSLVLKKFVLAQPKK
jgi:hypothetical protein